jgi:hypothetical protein
LHFLYNIQRDLVELETRSERATNTRPLLL